MGEYKRSLRNNSWVNKQSTRPCRATIKAHKQEGVVKYELQMCHIHIDGVEFSIVIDLHCKSILQAISRGCQRRLLAKPSMDEEPLCPHAYYCPFSVVSSIQGSVSCIFLLDENHHLERLTL